MSHAINVCEEQLARQVKRHREQRRKRRAPRGPRSRPRTASRRRRDAPPERGSQRPAGPHEGCIAASRPLLR